MSLWCPPPSPGTESICKMQTTKKTEQGRNYYQPGKEADKLCSALNHQTSGCTLGLPHLPLQEGYWGFPRLKNPKLFPIVGEAESVLHPTQASSSKDSSMGAQLWNPPNTAGSGIGSGVDTKHTHPTPGLALPVACRLQRGRGYSNGGPIQRVRRKKGGGEPGHAPHNSKAVQTPKVTLMRTRKMPENKGEGTSPAGSSPCSSGHAISECCTDYPGKRVSEVPRAPWV